MAGASVRFAGQVGEDSRGHELVRMLADEGVDVRVHFNGSTGTVVALVDDTGERSFLTSRAAATGYRAPEAELLDEVGWIHMPGYSFADGSLADTSHSLMGEAVERSIPRSISTGSESMLREFGRAEFHILIETLEPTVVIANEPEARFLLDDHRAFPGAIWTVITRGAAAATITHRNGEYRSVRPSRSMVVDSTGAGDAFAGGFLASWLEGSSPVEAVHAGHAMASRSLGLPGAQLEEPQ